MSGSSKSNANQTSTTTNVVDNSVTMVDAGALETATDIATRSLDAAEAMHRDSLSLADNAVSGALDLGERSVSGVIEFADRTGDRQLESQADALSFGRSVVGGAIDAVSAAGNDALSFGRQIIGGAIDAVTGSQLDTLNFADRQNARVSDAFMGAGDMLASAYESAFDTASDVLREGQAQVATTVGNLNAIARQASTSDAERNQAIVKYALIAAAVMVVAFALRSN